MYIFLNIYCQNHIEAKTGNRSNNVYIWKGGESSGLKYF